MHSFNYSIHDLIDTIIVILNSRDPYTFEHSWRVSSLSELIVKEMKISKEYEEIIHIAAHLHDIGKIGISDKILMNPGKLTKEEYEEMKDHPKIGYDIVRGIEDLKEIAPYILHHHERWDGKGYPCGLNGVNIPLGARIIAVADTFDAITSHRSYSHERSYDFAYKEIKIASGTQLCPEICNIFLRLKNKIPIVLEKTNSDILMKKSSYENIKQKSMPSFAI